MNIKTKAIYIVPTWHCNLQCPHCFVHLKEENYNKTKFINALYQLKNQYPNANFILHGGEPTLYSDRYYDIINTNIITSICSNLIISNNILDNLNSKNISIATSWNPYRFNIHNYKLWLHNIKKLHNKPLILITLDKDLINYDMAKFIVFLKDMENVQVTDILFEPLVDNTLNDNFQDEVDKWLCNIYTVWRENQIKLNNLIEDQILNWNFRCNSLTLYPNGEINKGCILGSDCYRILDKCLKCNFSNVCLPCVLHSRCSFYPKFYELVYNAK